MGRAFDAKFGDGFVAGAPDAPGVYLFLGPDGAAVYVGKAASLRRRLAQYRNAGRRRRDRKPKSIVALASSLRWEVCATALDAGLRELALIRELSPPLNVASKFFFLYPLLGLDGGAGELRLGYSTRPESLAPLPLFGAFRSRKIVKDAYFALVRLMGYVGHPEPARRPADRFTRLAGFRRVPEGVVGAWTEFLAGRSRGALEDLVVSLLARPGARRRASEVQEDVDALDRFWRKEAVPLREALATEGLIGPVAQEERDSLLLRHRAIGG